MSVFHFLKTRRKLKKLWPSFNERMDSLDQSYDLDDQDREFLAKELKGLETEEILPLLLVN